MRLGAGRMPVSRKRSCANCRVAKTRCSLTLPVCTRCKFKRLECMYGQHPLDRDLSPPQLWRPNGTASKPDAFRHNSASADEVTTIDQQMNFDNDFCDLDDVQAGPNWSSGDPSSSQGGTESSTERMGALLEFAGVDQDRILGATGFQVMPDSNLQLQSFPVTPAAYDAEPGRETTFEGFFAELQPSPGTALAVNWPLWCASTPKNYSRLLHPRKLSNVGSLLTSKYLLSVINSYPYLMCEARALPPFIHPRCTNHNQNYRSAGDDELLQLPETLAICSGIVHMYRNKTPANTDYIWRTISLEQQRFYSEFNTYDQWKLLATVQAIIIYLLLQAMEQQQNGEIAFQLLITMSETAEKLITQHGYYCSTELKGTFPKWEDWIFAESVRRTMMLIFMIERLLDISMGLRPHEDCTGLDIIPLPCSERLWKAESRPVWETRYKEYLTGRKSSGMQECGMLRESQHCEIGAVDKSRLEDLESWATGIDEFGVLLMIAAKYL